MTTLICGSLAFDNIMVFPDRFKNHILPEQIHILNVAFLVPELRREYGGCAGNIAYNLMLYIGLWQSPYLLYSIYLLCFLSMNMAYTGHGYQWLWPESPQWQLWSNPILIMAYSVSGLAFALQFLSIKICLPRIYRIVITSCLSFVALLLLIKGTVYG